MDLSARRRKRKRNNDGEKKIVKWKDKEFKNIRLK